MIEARVGGPITGVVEADHDVPTRDGSSIVVRSYTPEKVPPRGSPLLVMYHGGGFCIGDLLTLTPLCRSLAMKLGAVVLNVAYRLAPEHPFPIPIYDSEDALNWVCLDAMETFDDICSHQSRLQGMQLLSKLIRQLVL